MATSKPLDTFASATSFYKKIVGNDNSYAHYAARCTGELFTLLKVQNIHFSESIDDDMMNQKQS